MFWRVARRAYDRVSLDEANRCRGRLESPAQERLVESVGLRNGCPEPLGLLAIVAVDGADEAVRVANDTEYGLSASGGRAALEEFTELRWISIQELPREYPI